MCSSLFFVVLFQHFAAVNSGLLIDLVNKLNGMEWQGQKLRIELSKNSGAKCVRAIHNTFAERRGEQRRHFMCTYIRMVNACID